MTVLVEVILIVDEEENGKDVRESVTKDVIVEMQRERGKEGWKEEVEEECLVLIHWVGKEEVEEG